MLRTAMNLRPIPRRSVITLIFLLALTPAVHAQEKRDDQPSIESVFRAAQFERWAREGPRQEIQWKHRLFSHGLSIHQRMVAHVEIEIPGVELVKRTAHGRLVALVEVEDSFGQRYRDYGFIDLRDITSEHQKQTWVSTWEAFALPGQYTAKLMLYDPVGGEHSFEQAKLKIEGLKNDSFAQIWRGVPAWEFWAPLKELRDNIYRPDIESRLYLPLQTKARVQVDVLADLTPSDLFHGSSRFYSRFLSVALPLVKDLSQLQVTNGSLDVATLNLREHRVTFDQENVQTLDWDHLKNAVAAENGPATISLTSLQQKHETPDFMRDELLRRLTLPSAEEQQEARAASGKPFHVFIVVGSPMDFYAFHHFPAIEQAAAENCVVYYLQYEVYGPYATGALGNVKKMLKPLPIHTIKVRTPESVRQALQRIVREVGEL